MGPLSQAGIAFVRSSICRGCNGAADYATGVSTSGRVPHGGQGSPRARGRLRNFLATLGSPTYIGTISEQRRLETSALDGANAWTTPNDERNSSRLASNVRSGFSGIRRKCADTTRQLPGQQFGRARRAANFVRRQVNGRFGQ